MVPHVEVLTLDDLCLALKLGPKTIYRLCARKKLRRVPNVRVIRVTRKSLEEFLAGN